MVKLVYLRDGEKPGTADLVVAFEDGTFAVHTLGTLKIILWQFDLSRALLRLHAEIES